MKKIVLILSFIGSLSILNAGGCCCYPISCVAIEASIRASVEATIQQLESNDKNIYAKKLAEMNDYLIRINDIEKEIAQKEQSLVYVEKAESYYTKKKIHFLEKIAKLEEQLAIANNALTKQEITESEIRVLESIIPR